MMLFQKSGGDSKTRSNDSESKIKRRVSKNLNSSVRRSSQMKAEKLHERYLKKQQNSIPSSDDVPSIVNIFTHRSLRSLTLEYYRQNPMGPTGRKQGIIFIQTSCDCPDRFMSDGLSASRPQRHRKNCPNAIQNNKNDQDNLKLNSIDHNNNNLFQSSIRSKQSEKSMMTQVTDISQSESIKTQLSNLKHGPENNPPCKSCDGQRQKLNSQLEELELDLIDLEEGGEKVGSDQDQVFDDDKTKIRHSLEIPKIVHNQKIIKPRTSLKNSTSVPEVILSTQSTEETLIDDFEEMDLSRFDEFKDSIFGMSLSPPKPVHSVHQKSRSTPVQPLQRVLETSFDGIEVDEEFYSRRNQKSRYDSQSVKVTIFE